jgi:RNA polymerase sigma-70 factor (ECF subfamily)
MGAGVAAEERTDDLEFARLIRERDGRAFEAVMRAHNRLLYRTARSILKDDAEAEDAVQEAYLAAYRHIDSFRGGAKLSTWLARIVMNEAYARLRKQRHSGVVVPLPSATYSAPYSYEHGEPYPEGDMIDEMVEQPETAAMRTELRRLLERQIDALPDQFRSVYILRDVEELSVEETAECLDLTPATVRTRAFRARALLRESLSRDIDLATVDAFGFDGQRCDRVVCTVLQRLALILSRVAPDVPGGLP